MIEILIAMFSISLIVSLINYPAEPELITDEEIGLETEDSQRIEDIEIENIEIENITFQ